MSAQFGGVGSDETGAPGSAKILIVDDTAFNIEIMQLMIQSCYPHL
jgi:hypothetical protein